jgi:hypothetical protein
MTVEQFRSDWVPFRDALLTKYPGLSDGDLTDADGSTARLAEILSEREGVTPAEAQEDLHAFLSGPMPSDAYASPAHDERAARQSARYVGDGEDPLADDRRFGDDHVADRPMGRDR